MQIRRQFKGRKIKDNQGYLDSNKQNFTNSKEIDGGDITMKGVKMPVVAMPLDENGNPIGISFMKPGEEHKFKGASKTIEAPVFKRGGRLPKYQFAGGFDPNADVNGVTDPNNINQFNNPFGSSQEFESTFNTELNIPQPTTLENNASDFINSSSKLSGTTAGLSGQAPEVGDINTQGLVDANLRQNEAEEALVKGNKEKPPTDPIEENAETSLYNPYAFDTDLGARLYTAGKDLGTKGMRGVGVVGAVGATIGMARNFVSGMGAANVEAQQLKEANEKNREAKIGRTTALAKEGGYFQSEGEAELLAEINYAETDDKNKASFEQELTGNFKSGNDPDANAELEKGEFYRENGGTPTEVLGNFHDNKEGGESIKLDNATIISNFSKPNKAQLKDLNDNFELGMKAKDTFAKGLSNFNKKSGLTALIEEEVQIIEDIKKQKIKAAEKGSDTATFNINLEFLSGRLKNIADAKIPLENMASAVFDKIYDLQESNKPKKESNQPTFKLGGQTYSKEAILEVANKFGMTKERAMEVFEEMGQEEFHEGGKKGHTHEKEDKNTLEIGATEGIFDIENKVQHTTNKEIRLAGDVNDENFVSKMSIIEEEFPTAFNETYEKVEDDNGNISIVFKEGKSHKDLQEDINGVYNKLIEEIKGRGYDAELEKEFITRVEAEMFKEGEQFKGFDSIFGNFTSTRKNFTLSDLEQGNVDPAPDTEAPEGETVEEKVRREELLLLPNQEPLPPSSLVLGAKLTPDFKHVESELAVPDAMLTELNRNFTAAEAQIANLPSGQQEAALIQLASNKQKAADKIGLGVELGNKAIKQKDTFFNARQDDRTEQARVNSALSYEQRTFQALANTEDDFRRFFNTAQERNVANFNTINSLNLLNQSSENFTFGNKGVVKNADSGYTNEDMAAIIRYNQAMRTSGVKPQATLTKSKTTKRDGGRIRRKKIKRK